MENFHDKLLRICVHCRWEYIFFQFNNQLDLIWQDTSTIQLQDLELITWVRIEILHQFPRIHPSPHIHIPDFPQRYNDKH